MLTLESAVNRNIVLAQEAYYMPWYCDYCNKPILISKTGRQMSCANPYCPEHLSHRGEYMFKLLDYKGVGAKTLKPIIIANNLTSHVDLLDKSLYSKMRSVKGKLLFKYASSERSVSLHDVLKMADLPNLENSAFHRFSKFRSFQDYFSTYPHDFLYFQSTLLRVEGYFHIKEPFLGDIINIAITGKVLDGIYHTKALFIRHLNNMYGDDKYFHLQPSVTQGTDFLIRDTEVSTIKVDMAVRYGVPVVTSQALINTLHVLFPEKGTYIPRKEED